MYILNCDCFRPKQKPGLKVSRLYNKFNFWGVSCSKLYKPDFITDISCICFNFSMTDVMILKIVCILNHWPIASKAMCYKLLVSVYLVSIPKSTTLPNPVLSLSVAITTPIAHGYYSCCMVFNTVSN